MATAAEHRPAVETTRALLEQIARGDLGAKLRSQVAAWNPGATVDQIEEAFQEACARADRLCAGQSEGEVYVWLRTTTHRELGHMRRRAQREVLVDVSSPAFEPVDRIALTPPDELIDREDEAEIERLTHAVLDRLSERQRDIAALHSHGLRRPQIAERLGLTQRVVKRSLEHILAAGRDELVRLAGHGCEDGERLVSRYAFGLAAQREARQAQLHLTTCSRCGAMYERLDLWREKVAALLPVPAVADDPVAAVERIVHAGTDLVASPDPHAGAASGLRRHFADAVAATRDHATMAYYRTVDPTPLAGARPGAVAAAVAGCLAIGGGATYCVEQGVRPLAGIIPDAPKEQRAESSKRDKRRAARATRKAAAPVTVVPASAQPTIQRPTPVATTQSRSDRQPQQTTKAPPPPAPEDEFEPASVGSESSASVTATAASTSSASGSAPAQAAPPVRAKPAPAPAAGPGEFDGP